MKPLEGLRCVDHETQRVGHTRALLSCAGYQPNADILLTGSRYLRFSTSFADGACLVGYVDVAAWLVQTLPQLDGLDWSSLDEAMMPSLVGANPLQLSLAQQHSAMREIQVSQIVGDVVPLDRMPRLASNVGWIPVEQFQFGEPRKISSDEKLATLSMPIEFQLGQTKLPLRSLSAIELGDILLISAPKLRVIRGQKTLFTFALHQESIMILEPEEQIDTDDSRFAEMDDYYPEQGEPVVAVKGNPLGQQQLAGLPVELSFVLLEKSVTLAELQAMAPGEIVELPQNQFRQVDIRVNHQTFARGELVQLADGQLGIEIHRICS